MRNNNFVSKNSSSVFIILISLFIIVFVIVGYFMLSDNMFKSSYQRQQPLRTVTSCVGDCSGESNASGDKEVFNIRENRFTFEEAKAVCKAHDSELATLEQVIDAYKRGANWCSYGWSEGQLALYPTQSDFWNKLQQDSHKKNECGKPGVNGGYFENPNYRFGANCYGVKPQPKSNEIEKERDYRMDPLKMMANQYREEKNDIRISPFSNDNWSNHSE